MPARRVLKTSFTGASQSGSVRPTRSHVPSRSANIRFFWEFAVNVLAHLELAWPRSGWLAGAVLGDHWRGAPHPAWPEALRQGVVLHRRIDSFTDSHPRLLGARARFPSPYRRYAGILLDLWFDHRLAANAERLGLQRPAALGQALGEALAEFRSHLPAAALRQGLGLIDGRRLAAYREPAALARALGFLASRSSRHQPLAGGLAVLEPLAGPLEADFHAFWPELRAHVAELKSDFG
jgi:acyl carrier protein phosphodiesterase